MIRLLMGIILLVIVYAIYKEYVKQKRLLEKQAELDAKKLDAEVLDVEEEIALQNAENADKAGEIKQFQGENNGNAWSNNAENQ